jgi:hypothetical protein
VHVHPARPDLSQVEKHVAKADPKNTRNVETIQTPATAGAGPDDLPCKWDVVDGVRSCFVCGAGPDDECDHIARQRRIARIERYAQQINRKWTCLAELLTKGGDKQFRPLLNSLLKGEFNNNGRCRVLWLHPWSPPKRMTPEFMASNVKNYEATPSTIRDQFVARCWVPRETAVSWAKAHKIKLHGKSLRGRPRGQRQVENKNDAQYIRLAARYRAEGKGEHEAVRMALENQQFDNEKYRITFAVELAGSELGQVDALKQQRRRPLRRRAEETEEEYRKRIKEYEEKYRKREANRIRKKFREGQRS